MINGNDKQEGHRRSIDAERKELQQAARHFIRIMFRTGVSVALLPVNRLPRKPQQHFQAAGREFTRGLATLARELADGLEEIAEDANTSTISGEGPHTHEKSES
jgi:hypothetical protein